MTIEPLTLDPATLALVAVTYVVALCACARISVIRVEAARCRLDIGFLATEMVYLERQIATSERERVTFGTFAGVLRFRRRAGAARHALLPDLLDSLTLPRLAPVVLALDVEDDALPTPPHRLTGSLDRNAPPARALCASATGANNGTAIRADNRRREHSAAP